MTEDVRALSLRQPWAWLVVYGGKTIENRRWNTNRRGPVLLHAAKGMTRNDWDEAYEFAYGIDRSIARRIPARDGLLFGGIVGRATIVDVVFPCCPPEYVGGACVCGAGPWHIGTQYGFVLDEIAELPFRPLRGELGLFRVQEIA